MILFGAVLAVLTLFGFALGDPMSNPDWLQPWWTLTNLYLLEAAIFALIIGIKLHKVTRHVRLLRNGSITKGIVKWIEFYDWWGGEPTAKVAIRFVPAELVDLPDSDLLRNDISYFEVQATLPADLGSFGASLQPGSLISILYDRLNPSRNLIVEKFRSSK